MPKQRHSAKATHGREGRKAQRVRIPLFAWIGLGLVAVVAAVVLFIRPQPPMVTEVTVDAAYAKYQAGSFILDVRTQAEYNQGHIANSVLIPLEELQNRLSEVPRERDVVVICRSGVRSKEGAAILQQAGYTRVTCMAGGLQAWMAAGYPMEQ